MKLRLWPFEIWLVAERAQDTVKLALETKRYEFGLLVFRRWRSRHGYEWSKGHAVDGSWIKGSRWLNIWWGDPEEHRWWALSTYLILG